MTYGGAIALRLKQICKDRNITVNGLARLSGVRQSTLDNIVQGNTKNPKLRTLHRVAVGLNITVSELLNFVEMNETQFENE